MKTSSVPLPYLFGLTLVTYVLIFTYFFSFFLRCLFSSARPSTWPVSAIATFLLLLCPSFSFGRPFAGANVLCSTSLLLQMNLAFERSSAAGVIEFTLLHLAFSSYFDFACTFVASCFFAPLLSFTAFCSDLLILFIFFFA